MINWSDSSYFLSSLLLTMQRLSLYDFLLHRSRPVELTLLLKNLFDIRRREESNGTYAFYIDPVTHFGFSWLKYHSYEPEMTELLLSLLKDADVFIDVGGNEGYFSVIASKLVGEAGKVLIIEPQERLQSIIKKNIQLNHCSNTALLPIAIGENDSSQKVFIAPSLNSGQTSLVSDFSFLGSSSISKFLRKNFGKTQEFTICRLDSVLKQNEVSIAHVIKVDVEGFEFSVLKSCESMLQTKSILNLLVELHPQHLEAQGYNEKMILDFMSHFGYSHRKIHDRLIWFRT